MITNKQTNMDNEQLNLYRKIFEEQFKPLMDKWWSLSFERMEEGDLWNNEIEVLLCFFMPVYVAFKNAENETVNDRATFACMVPPTKHHWDLYSAMILLYGKDRFRYLRDVFQPMLAMIDDVKVDVDVYENFDSIIHSYLLEVVKEGRNDNLFFKDPYELYLTLHMIERFPGKDLREYDPKEFEKFSKEVDEKMKPVFDNYFKD